MRDAPIYAAAMSGLRILVLMVAVTTAAVSACLMAAEGEAEPQGRTPGHVTVLQIDGPIGLASAHYVIAGIEIATETGARAVVLLLDTPGGLDGPMRDIIKAILSSQVPVITYVSPSGARAASAGTYIL